MSLIKCTNSNGLLKNSLSKKTREEYGEIETMHPSYLGSQDTFYVGNMKGVGRIYQQTFVDTYSKVAFAKLYMMKTPISATDLLNDKVVPFFEENKAYWLLFFTSFWIKASIFFLSNTLSTFLIVEEAFSE